MSYIIQKVHHPHVSPETTGITDTITYDVGYFDNDRGFQALREFDTLDQAAAYVRYLNGGTHSQIEDRLARACEHIAESLQYIQRQSR
jgi:hypothetical protein